jgi:hypothetical protein
MIGRFFIVALLCLGVSACSECSVPTDCGAGETCHESSCIPGARSCSVDSGCAFGEICERGLCQSGERECEGNGECVASMVCRNHACITPAPGDGCDSHANCGHRMYCHATLLECRDLEPGRCWSNRGCDDAACVAIDDTSGLGHCDGGGGDCAGVTCSGATPHCAADRCVECTERSHCAANETCDANRCTPAASGCTSDEQCGGGTPRCDLGSGNCVACLGADDCPPNHACEHNACRDLGGGGGLAYGAPCSVASECSSGYAGIWNNRLFCSMPCGYHGDCPGGSGCMQVTGGALDYCLPGTVAGATFAGPQSQACGSAGDCQSMICANTDNGPICQADCNNDQHCPADQACMGLNLGDALTHACGALVGTAPNGSVCDPGGQNQCASAICDNTTNTCQPLCCSSADCGAGQACNLTWVDAQHSLLFRVCGAPQGAGIAPVGSVCAADSACLSNSCENGRCSDVCCTDSDCAGGLRCRPKNLGDDQQVILINLCQ